MLKASRTAMGDPPAGASLFWRFLTASGISLTRSAVTAVAMPLITVQVLHASAIQVSIVAAAQYSGWIAFGLPAGVLVGRLPLRGVQITMDLARTITVATVPIAWWTGHLTVKLLVFVTAVVSFTTVAFEVGT
jgi:hypothetical protein